jgi:DNA relaxase NicK
VRFDWYSATVRERPEVIIAGLREDLSGWVTEVERRKGSNNYEASDVGLDYFGGSIFSVLHGGPNGAPHVRASGAGSPVVADVLRRRWPQHAVSRVDVAVDFDGEGCWDKLFAVCADVARERGLKWTTYGDFREDRDVMAGRTVYIGSRQSPVMVRLYEKGKQMLPSVRVGEKLPSLNWCRLEVEVKPPQREARLAAAIRPAEQFWGCSSWSRKLLHRACGTDVERVTMTVRRETDARRAIRHLAMQYRQSIETVIAEEGGDDEALMRLIREVWREADRSTRAA